MPIVTAIALLLALILPCIAEERKIATSKPLWPGEYKVRPGKITVWYPTDPNGAAAIICPGGGYGRLMNQPEGHKIARWLNEHGITGIVLEYELPKGRSEVPLQDAQRALRMARANAKEWKIDPKRLGIFGFSAGGHLASTAGTHFDGGDPEAADPIERESCRPDFMVLIYPVISMGEHTHGGSKRNLLGKDPSPELIKKFSNELQVTEKTPPAYLAHAIDDKVVVPENSRNFHAALKAKGVSSEYLELPGGGHGLNGYKGPHWDAWQEGSIKWLAKQGIIPKERPKRTFASLQQELQPDKIVTYKKIGDRELTLHFFHPEGFKATDKRPAFVAIHGGGWRSGTPRRFYPYAQALVPRGYVGVSVEYRLTTSEGVTVHDCVKDARAAIRYLRAHAAEIGIDPEKISVGGGSAGAHLALGTALFDGVDHEGEDLSVSCRPDAVVPYFAVLDVSPKGYGNKLVGPDWKTVCPLQRIRPGMPPTLIFHGDQDKVAPMPILEAFVEKMKASGNTCELVLEKGGKHGHLNADMKLFDVATERVASFLGKQGLGPSGN